MSTAVLLIEITEKIRPIILSIDWNSGCYGSLGLFSKIICWILGILGGIAGGFLGFFLFHWTTSWLTILLMADAGKVISQISWFLIGAFVGWFFTFGFFLALFCGQIG